MHQWFRQKQINKSFTLCLLCTVLGRHLPKWLANEKACLIFRQIGLSGPPGILSINSQWLHLDVAYKILMMSWHVLMLVASWHNERYFSPRFWSWFMEFGICMRRPFFYENSFIVLVWIPYFKYFFVIKGKGYSVINVVILWCSIFLAYLLLV